MLLCFRKYLRGGKMPSGSVGPPLLLSPCFHEDLLFPLAPQSMPSCSVSCFQQFLPSAGLPGRQLCFTGLKSGRRLLHLHQAPPLRAPCRPESRNPQTHPRRAALISGPLVLATHIESIAFSLFSPVSP